MARTIIPLIQSEAHQVQGLSDAVAQSPCQGTRQALTSDVIFGTAH